MTDKIIRIVDEFTPYPGGRFPVGKNDSGQELREGLLWPELEKAIKGGYRLIINLDGGAGFGSSFLDEAFGGLVRIHRVSRKTLSEKLRFISDEDPYCVEEIWEYIDNAASGK